MNKSIRLILFSLSTVLVASLMYAPTASAGSHKLAKAGITSGNPSALVGSTRTLLPDGRWLLVGGQDRSGRVQPTLSVVNPTTGEITDLDVSLRYPRAGHPTTVLPDGTAVILGGIGEDG